MPPGEPTAQDVRPPRRMARATVPPHHHLAWASLLLACVLILALLPGPLRAEEGGGDGDAVRLEDAGTGTLLFRTATPGLFREAPRVNTEAEFQVSGLVAQVTVRQEFRNPGSDWLEGIYVFPLPEMAAVNALKMKIGERVIVGEIQEKEQARKTYEAAKKAGKRASLVAQERANLFTTAVANLGPGETVVVEIRYLETLRYQDGGFSLRFPMTLTPRYIPGAALPEADRQGTVAVSATGWAAPTDEVPDADRVTPPQAYGLAPDTQMAKLGGRIDAGFELQEVVSPHHRLQTRNEGGAVHFQLAGDTTPMDRDFILRWKPRIGVEPQAAFFAERKNGAHYGLLMLMPPQSRAVKHLPREVIFVIDTSGSMAGTSIRQAREALTLALARLRPEDRFNVIEFNSDYSRLFREPVHGTTRNLESARKFVGRLRANGGTEMAKPLRAALSGTAAESYLRQVIFITDGSIGNEEALFGIIERELGGSRLFLVGIGSAPNTFFMEKAAQFGRGTATFISDLNEVSDRMEDLFRRIESPVATDLQVDWGVPGAEVWPQRVRDLYLGEPLVLTARLVQLPARVEIRGMLDGQSWQRTVEVPARARRIVPLAAKGGGARPTHAAQPEADTNGVGTLWARNKVASLLDRERTGGTSGELRKEIIDVATLHTLVTKYTSFVAVDRTPARPDDQQLKQRAAPNRMPHGAQMTGFPQGATPAGLQILAGLALLLLGLVLARRTANPPASVPA